MGTDCSFGRVISNLLPYCYLGGNIKKAVLAVAFALVFAFCIIASFHSVNGSLSINEDSSKRTITLNETVDFSVDTNPASLIKWYCDDVLVQSEYAAHSNFTFIPEALGIYYIKLSINGFTDPMGPKKVTVTEEQISTSTPTQTTPPSYIHFYNDTHFAVRQTLWAFDGYHNVGSFNATENDYLQFNIQTTNADPDRPDDVFTVSFKIQSSNGETSYVSATAFNQKVKLNHTDTYTISYCKHPFFASVNVVGSIDLHRGVVLDPTPTQKTEPSNNPTLTPTKNSSSEYASSLNLLFPAIMLGTIGVVAILLAAAIYLKKRR